MSLRARIAAAAGLAVAVAVLVAATAVYVAVRSDLRGELDHSLQQRATAFLPPPAGATAVGGGPQGGAPPAGGAAFPPDHNGFPSSVQPQPLGGPSGYVQFVSPDGAVHVPAGQGQSRAIALSAVDRRIARSGAGRALSDRTVGTTRVRVLTEGTGVHGAVMVARPLGEVEHELHRVALILAIVGIAGIAIAALLGALVARAALAPIARFTRRTETLAGTLDVSQRLPEQGGDELARLARSFNATLDALERSVRAQRGLVADASHELRTPIASLRANIQVLAEAERLPAEDQASLRADIVEELDELTRLVADVVELARGVEADTRMHDVRLDEIVRDALARARRRSQLRFTEHLQPTTIRGDGPRIARAVGNALDNACKWSPAGAVVEVDLRDGVLSVRDHGPGFEETDLPHVFERFHRSESARSMPGSGLGLAIVHQAAEAHGGWTRAANAEGGGAIVQVSFGSSSPPPPPPPVVEPDTQP